MRTDTIGIQQSLPEIQGEIMHDHASIKQSTKHEPSEALQMILLRLKSECTVVSNNNTSCSHGRDSEAAPTTFKLMFSSRNMKSRQSPVSTP